MKEVFMCLGPSNPAKSWDIRVQLIDQLKCLDQRIEQQASIVGELQDFFKRKADVESEYAKNLDRLAKNLLQKQKAEKQRRECWSQCSVFSLYQTLIQVTRKQSRDHAVLGELYANNLSNRLLQTSDDLTRIYRRCREIGVESHEELFKVHNELHTALKTYFLCLNDCRQTETKYRIAEEQRLKIKNSIPEEKQSRNRKLKVWTKETAKKQTKFEEAKAKLLKARNEYLLSLNSANAALHKYFAEDLPELMDCMDFGLHRSVASALKIHQQATEQMEMRNKQYELEIKHCIDNFDSRADKQKFIENNHTVFMLPRKFDFHSQIGDEIREVTNDPLIQDELIQRFMQLTQRITGLRTENEEIWKTLDTAERTLIGMIDLVDCDVEAVYAANGPASFSDERRLYESVSNGSPAPGTPIAKLPETAVIKKKADKAETEQFYLSKFQEFMLNSNLITRLQAKQKLLQNALGNDILNGKTGALVARHSTLPPKPRRRRIAQLGSASQRPKLFGGSLEEYIEATGQEIPVIIRSCIRVIRQYGLHHQGIFRVSGSQVEINNFRDAFERGEDPLADVCDGSDINSIAGVFKLYLRELREPLFPLYMFDQLMEISKLEAKEEFVKQIRELLMSLPRSVFIVMRYLIAFLNHLSDYSDENMMDRFNLAICFGPTLLPIPESRDQVQYQQRVNVLIKNIFLYQEDIFPQNFGVVYEKYDVDVGEITEHDALGSSENLSDDETEQIMPDTSEDEGEHYEATAVFDFSARTLSELTVRKGDLLLLLHQINPEWWRARLLTGTMAEGLIPDKYIEIKRRISGSSVKNGLTNGKTGLHSSLTGSLESSSASSGSTTTSGEDATTGYSLSTLDLSPRSSPVKLNHEPPTNDSVKSNRDADGSTVSKNLSEQLVITEKTPRETLEERRRKNIEYCRHLSADAAYPVQTTPIPPSPRSPRPLTSPIPKDVPRYYFGGDSSSPHSANRKLEAGMVVSLYEPITLRREKSCGDNVGTPDLVMNLPIKSSSPSYLTGCTSDNSPDTTAAERFARSNQGTMKKGETKLGIAVEEIKSAKAPGSPSLNNFSLHSYEERAPITPRHEKTYSDPSASIDELLESLKAVASPRLTGADVIRPTVAPKPQFKSKPTVAQKPGSGKKGGDLSGSKFAVSKPTSC
ncbi:SLIT-ROBO Rho GTPase-activating protein 1-like isoform X2 [Paramacrobiotus metropolitanus]|uniref:SLIT-ROBO Rho GTPase-activating protein 1-like isoform X2 n=1 Tax=Paramacrobiotus metropolitanus TaxID=2943436 RepID=UPI00244574B0|nr:SLIT-ROBO Rho GTPase-activating protein 1-like isoform X2 [Paramacrobiotus metropolitanus]